MKFKNRFCHYTKTNYLKFKVDKMEGCRYGKFQPQKSNFRSGQVRYGNLQLRLGQVRLGMGNFDLKSAISGQVRLGMKKFNVQTSNSKSS